MGVSEHQRKVREVRGIGRIEESTTDQEAAVNEAAAESQPVEEQAPQVERTPPDTELAGFGAVAEAVVGPATEDDETEALQSSEEEKDSDDL